MKALYASTVFLSCKTAAEYTRAHERSRTKVYFFVDALEIKRLCWLWSHGLSQVSISDIKKMRPAFWSPIMKEETMAHEANTQPHETTRARWQRRLAARP